MPISYLQSKSECIRKQMDDISSEIKSLQERIDDLAKKHIFLQGSLASVGELIDYYNTGLKGGDDEKN